MNFERAHGKINVASLVERKTRFAVLFRNNDRSTNHLMNRLMGGWNPYPNRRENRSPLIVGLSSGTGAN